MLILKKSKLLAFSFILLFACFINKQIKAQCHINDWTALKALYESTDGDNWRDNTGWEIIKANSKPTNCNLEKLYGVKMDEQGRISSLVSDYQLYGNNLNGYLPPELGLLTNLTVLELDYNRLAGSIPSELGNLTILTILKLDYNQLSGSIPSELGNLKKLIGLELGNNDLSGNIPPELGELTNLTTLDFISNELSGSIPPELGELTNLTVLNLYENQLNGSISPELGDLTNLTVLDLRNNQLSENIPPELGNLTNLTLLLLNENQLSGSIPSELSHLTNLTRLDLGNNKLIGNIPPELGSLTNLAVLYLRNNQLVGCYDKNLSVLCDQLGVDLIFQGNNLKATWENFCKLGVDACSVPQCNIDDWTALKALYENTDGDKWAKNNNWELVKANIPPTDCNLEHLQGVELAENGRVVELYLGYNELTGSIPPQLGNLTNLTRLDLYSNQLSGNIPPQLGNLINLPELDLSDNQLSGSIPPQLANLTNLTRLDLSENQLSDSIPTELGNLTNLTFLGLKENQLSGSIPNQLGVLNSMSDLDLSDNQLSGSIPLVLSNLTNLRSLKLYNNQLNGSIPPQLGKLSNLYELLLFDNQLSGCYDENLAVLCDRFVSSHISEGNNFEASWDNFCEIGVDACLVSKCNVDDWMALKAFYENTNGNKWTVNEGWEQVIGDNPPIDCNLGNLYGVSLNEKGRVHSIILHNNQLKGKISPELAGLTNLTRLELQYNDLSGSIPPELGNLTNLAVLRLHSNELSGSIPPEFGNLTNLTFLSLYENQLSGNIPLELGNSSYLSGLDLHSNYFSCADLQNIFSFNLNLQHYNYAPQLYTPTNYESIFTNTFDSITINHKLVVEIPFDTTGFTYQWFRNGTAIPSANEASLNLYAIRPKNVGEYTLQLTNENCLPDGKIFTTNSEPIYVILKGYDLYGQPVEYDQIMVEFDNKEDTKKYEGEILMPNAGWVKKACNCNRELYLWQFPSTEAAVAALLEIDRKWKRIKGRSRPKGGFNNNINIGETNNIPVAYNLISETYNESYSDSALIFLLDSGLDTIQANFTIDEAPVDECYEIGNSTGYSYVDSLATITTDYSDELWHGSFGYHSISEYLKDESALKVVPLKIFDKNGKGNLFDMVCAVYHAIDHKADIINISAGYYGEPSEILESAVNLAREKGIFITAAAGNDTTNIDNIPQYPAYYASQYYLYETVDASGTIKLDSVKYDNVISVASINAQNQLSQFSNRGKESVTIACYGENIHGYGIDNVDVVASGTSMSTFLTTKALALEIAKDNKRNHQQIWTDFETNWLIVNPLLLNVTQTGKQIDFTVEEAIIKGCTDANSLNYFELANEDDGSCIISNIENELTGFAMYPNPTEGKMQLILPAQSILPVQIMVVDCLGKAILSINSTDRIIELNLKAKPKGIYFVRINTNEETVIRKLVLK